MSVSETHEYRTVWECYCGFKLEQKITFCCKINRIKSCKSIPKIGLIVHKWCDKCKKINEGKYISSKKL